MWEHLTVEYLKERQRNVCLLHFVDCSVISLFNSVSDSEQFMSLPCVAANHILA